jgi:hypothetical protein
MIKVKNLSFTSDYDCFIPKVSNNISKSDIGVYILYNSGGEAIYVGQGVIYDRLVCHCKNINKEWIEASVLNVELKSHRLLLEAILIRYMLPCNNKDIPKIVNPELDDNKLTKLYLLSRELHKNAKDMFYLKNDFDEAD